MGDPVLLKGFGNLISPDVLDGGLDLAELERKLYGTAPQPASSADAARARLQATAVDLGVDIGGFTPRSTPLPTPIATPRPTPQIRSSYEPSYEPTPPIASYADMTLEETNRSRIAAVINDMAPSPVISFAAEKARDEKLQLIAEIDELREQLIAANCRIDGIRQVNEQSTHDDILAIRNILRFKDDRLKYSAMASDMLMFLAYGVEDLFNGEREWFGYKFDMRGWAPHVQVKLRRIQWELSSFMSNIFQDNGISPAFRLAFELIPSAVIYSRTRAAQFGQPLLNPNDDAAYEAATARLNDLRSRDDFAQQ
jgi:hypothetical protein